MKPSRRKTKMLSLSCLSHARWLESVNNSEAKRNGKTIKLNEHKYHSGEGFNTSAYCTITPFYKKKVSMYYIQLKSKGVLKTIAQFVSEGNALEMLMTLRKKDMKARYYISTKASKNMELIA